MEDFHWGKTFIFSFRNNQPTKIRFVPSREKQQYKTNKKWGALGVPPGCDAVSSSSVKSAAEEFSWIDREM